MNMARIAAMAADLPVTVPGTTVNRFCSSGSQAVAMAAHLIVNEGYDAAIGAGVETITMMQDGTQNTTRMVSETARARFPGLYFPMGITAEVVAERYGVSREDQDAYALLSQQRTAAFQDNGYMAEEIAPMKVTRKVVVKDGDDYEEEFVADKDECNRPSTTLEGLQKLKPVFKKEEEGGTVTAGNASQLSDGASANLLMSADRAKELNIEPMGIYRGSAVAGCQPDEMGIGPIYAVPQLLKRHGLTMNDIDLVELNEAFASQALQVQARARDPGREAQPERRLDLDRPPVRHDGRAPHRHAAPRAQAPRWPLRHRDDVRRRRPGLRVAVRGRVGSATNESVS